MKRLLLALALCALATAALAAGNFDALLPGAANVAGGSGSPGSVMGQAIDEDNTTQQQIPGSYYLNGTQLSTSGAATVMFRQMPP